MRGCRSLLELTLQTSSGWGPNLPESVSLELYLAPRSMGRGRGDRVTDHRQVTAFSQHQPWQSHLAGLVLAGSCLPMQVFHSHHCGVICGGSLVSQLPFARPGPSCALWHLAHSPSLCRLWPPAMPHLCGLLLPMGSCSCFADGHFHGTWITLSCL